MRLGIPGGITPDMLDGGLAEDLAAASLAMARQFAAGGTLWCVAPTWEPHAHHIAVEFVHPVIVGKRALPAFALTGPDLDPRARVAVRPGDLLIAVAGWRDAAVADLLRRSSAWGAASAWIGSGPRPPAGAADHLLWIGDPDPMAPATGRFVLLYHLLWELTHVCFEHPGLLAGAITPAANPRAPTPVRTEAGEETAGREPRATAFLYPFLEAEERDAGPLLAELALSARAKAAESAALQQATLAAAADQLAACGSAMAERFAAGGRLYAFGNGGSSTDCATFAMLFAAPPTGAPAYRAMPALNLAADQAVVTALGNDVGFDLVFSRQIIAHAAARDIAVAFSTSGNSRDLMAALREAHGRGLLTVGFAGYDGGEMAASGDVDYCFVVRSQSVHRIQESQALLGYHLWAATQQSLRRASRQAPQKTGRQPHKGTPP
ncbi:MAG: SIS domain-containing protein [Trebonia sp.]|jgi:D-sedoheptulose 7-phosphate isomerase